MKIYLGSYTDQDNTAGLRTLHLDEATGKLDIEAEYDVPMGIYQALSPDKSLLLSCTATGLASFRADGPRLVEIDEAALGSCPCHVAATPDWGRALFANYLGGFAGSVELDGGRFGAVVRHDHSGSGPNLPRQDKAHCHQAVPTPDGAGYCVVDLGLDEIVEYPSGRVFHTPRRGAGPRHMLFHPNGRLAFLVHELGNLVSTLRWDAATGFRALDTQPTLPGGDTGRGPDGDLAAAVRLTPDLRRVVISNRGENSLVAYDYSESDGELSFKARSPLPGSWPRDFAFVSGDIALAAMERSGEVHTLRYDPESGIFEVVSTLPGLFRPVAITAS